MQVHCVTLLAFAHAALGSIFPVPSQLNNSEASIGTTIDHRGNAINAVTGKNTVVARRRAMMKARSTSSSSGERTEGRDKASGDSIGIKSSGDESWSRDSRGEERKPLEGKGWRKWHRKCTSCPDDMTKKWRDPTIKWICGGYQRARRSFKSECMMYYRNCQDGTMFVKLSDHRCDDKAPGYNGGRHFFYDYPVNMPDDTSGKTTESESASSEGTSESFSDKKSNSNDFE